MIELFEIYHKPSLKNVIQHQFLASRESRKRVLESSQHCSEWKLVLERVISALNCPLMPCKQGFEGLCVVEFREMYMSLMSETFLNSITYVQWVPVNTVGSGH